MNKTHLIKGISNNQKMSWLYLLAIEKKSEKRNIIERYIKFGRTTNLIERYKRFSKDYADYEIGYIWTTQQEGIQLTEPHAHIIEKILKLSLNKSFQKFSDFSDKKIHGYTEIYMAEQITDDEIVFYVKTELKSITRINSKDLNQLNIWGIKTYAN